jgi:serine/threonine protein kinase
MLPVEHVVRIALDVGAALRHAHEHVPSVIHRDVKPSNILIEHGTGRAMVTDFGIAKLVGSEVLRTRTGAVIGTVKYCAPEQLEGADIDARVDVFALGLVMCEMLTGRHPLDGLDEAQLDTGRRRAPWSAASARTRRRDVAVRLHRDASREGTRLSRRRTRRHLRWHL